MQQYVYGEVPPTPPWAATFSSAAILYLLWAIVKDEQPCRQTSNIQQLPDGARTTALQTGETIEKTISLRAPYTSHRSGTHATVHPPYALKQINVNYR